MFCKNGMQRSQPLWP